MSEPQLPTREDIAKLPRWARVAFAARCARLALQFFNLSEPVIVDDLPLRDLDEVVFEIEEAAGSAYYLGTHTDDAYLTKEFADQAGMRTATAAAGAVDSAEAVATDPQYDELVNFVLSSALEAGVTVEEVARDFQTLRETAQRGKWDDNTPVPPTVFGPLDDIVPTPVVEVPADAEPPKKFKIVIEAYATTTTDPDETGRGLVRLYHHLDEYCRLKYGRGITLKEFEQRIKIGAMVPAGGGQ